MADLGATLKIDQRDRTLVLSGEIDAHTAPELSTAIDRALDGAGSLRLVLEHVTFMDSSGLRVVIATTQRTRDAGGDLTLVTPSTAVMRLIEVSGLAEHLTIESAPAG